MQQMDASSSTHWYHDDDINHYINPATWMGFPNQEGISVYYDGNPIFPIIRQEKRFPWVLYARKFRNRGKFY